MNFSPHDPVGDAEDCIQLCHMKHGNRIAIYVIEFDQLTETVHLLYVLNMLVIACCVNNTKTTQTISYHSQKTSAILSEFGSGP